MNKMLKLFCALLFTLLVMTYSLKMQDREVLRSVVNSFDIGFEGQREILLIKANHSCQMIAMEGMRIQRKRTIDSPSRVTSLMNLENFFKPPVYISLSEKLKGILEGNSIIPTQKTKAKLCGFDLRKANWKNKITNVRITFQPANLI